MQKYSKVVLCAWLLVAAMFPGFAADVAVPVAEWEAIKARLNELEGRTGPASVVTSVDTSMESKFGPGANVTTKIGKLQIGLLTQVWYYGFQHDNRGLFDNAVTGIADTNQTQDAGGFRIRRTELSMQYELNEQIYARLMIDPAREAQGFANLPDNQGNIKRANLISPEFATFATANKLTIGLKNTGGVSNVQTGALAATQAPKLMQDAYINWHGCIPNHDFTIGQFKPHVGEEGIRSSGELDFVERSMLGFQADSRDLGVSVHGSWWNCPGADGKDNGYAACDFNNNGRFQYWVGAFNGAGSYFEPGNQQNRSDNNNDKDVNVRVLVRPLWDKCKGHLELGASEMGGIKGKGSSRDPINAPQNALERESHWASRGNVWVSYKCGDAFARGLWARSEVGYIRDQESPGTVLDVFGNGVTGTGTGNVFGQAQGKSFNRYGGYGALGYKFSDSQFRDCLPCWLKPVEVLGRWEEFQNVDVANKVDPANTDRFFTKAITGGINYYITGHNAKVQANYIVVQNPNNASARSDGFHNVKNNAFALNFQVMF